MQRWRFPIAVALTSLGLVTGLVVVGGVLAGRALASAPWMAGGPFGAWGGGRGPWAGGPFGSWAGGQGPWAGQLPPELAGLQAIPPADRFAHFQGVQVNLTDANGQPLSLQVTPGTVSAVSPGALTLAANDGATRTFALTDQTVFAGRSGGESGSQALAIAAGDQVVVVTLNGGATATAVLGSSPGAMGHGPWGRWSH